MEECTDVPALAYSPVPQEVYALGRGSGLLVGYHEAPSQDSRRVLLQPGLKNFGASISFRRIFAALLWGRRAFVIFSILLFLICCSFVIVFAAQLRGLSCKVSESCFFVVSREDDWVAIC